MSNAKKEEYGQFLECKYYLPNKSGTKGTCRKNAPRPSLKIGDTQWPKVEPEEGCWEFVRKTEPATREDGKKMAQAMAKANAL